MQQSQRVLVLSSDIKWQRLVQAAWSNFGHVDTVEGFEGAFDRIRAQVERRQPYIVVVVDASAVPCVRKSVMRIRQLDSSVRVVVLSAGPTWKQAREAFDAGAVYYSPKSLDVGEIQSILQEALKSAPAKSSNH